MNGNIRNSFIRIFVAYLVGQILVDGDPQLLAFNSDILCLNSTLVAIDDQGVDPGGSLAGEPAIVPFNHRFPRPRFKCIRTIRCRPCPHIYCFPRQRNIRMNNELLNVCGDLTTHLCLIRNFSRQVLCNGDPDFFPSFDNDAIRLNRSVSTLIGIHNDILNEIRNPGVVPALCQFIHCLTGPGIKCIRAIVCPSPQIGGLPVLWHLDHHGNHFAVFFSKRCQRQAGYH